MNLTVAAWDDRLFTIALDGGESLETLKAVLEAESGVPAAQQRLLLNGKPLASATTTLASAGLSDGDMLMLLPPEGASRPAAAGGGNTTTTTTNGNPEAAMREAMALGPDGKALRPAAFIQAARAAPRLLAQLERTFPPLADAVRSEDPAALQAALARLRSLQQEEQERLRAEDALLEADPFDAEAQAKIEALIRRKNVEESYEQAMEHAPEMFAPVTMLYCHMEINGVPVKAFVDSGAQMTIATEAFARKCFLERLLDTRFHGTAVGVGSSKILGRVHAAPMKVAGHFITSSITVLEQKSGPQFIFGLDMLKRHRCRLEFAPDAASGVGDSRVTGPHLFFGSCDVALPFLGDSEIPRDFAHDSVEERTEEDAAKSMSQAVGAPAEGGGGGGASGSGAAAAAGGAGGAGAAAGADAKLGGAAPAAPASGNGAGAAGGETKVDRLMALGFPRGVCEEALRAAGGSEDAAAAMLFGGLDG
jgi:DNA damage-inducible protein 1